MAHANGRTRARRRRAGSFLGDWMRLVMPPRDRWSDASDDELCAAAAAGDPAAFGVLYARHAGALRRYAYSMLRDAEESADVVNDTFVALWDRLQVGGPVDYPAGFLYRSVRNRCLNILKARRRRARLLEWWARRAGRPRRPDEEYIDEWVGRCVALALDRLDRRERDALYLRYFVGLTQAECAAACGLSVASFQLLLRRARRNARREMAECWEVMG